MCKTQQFSGLIFIKLSLKHITLYNRPTVYYFHYILNSNYNIIPLSFLSNSALMLVENDISRSWIDAQLNVTPLVICKFLLDIKMANSCSSWAHLSLWFLTVLSHPHPSPTRSTHLQNNPVTHFRDVFTHFPTGVRMLYASDHLNQLR